MFAENIPPNYKPVHINFDSYGDILEDTTKSKRTKPKAIRSNLQKRKADDFESSDHDSNDEGVKRKKSKPSEISSTLQTPVPVSSPLTPARPEFASTSFASIFQREEADESLGTPSAQDIGVEEAGDVGSDDEDSRIYNEIDSVKPGNVIKAHSGAITTVEVCDVEICPMNGFYRAQISDGEKRSNKVLFHANLNKRVE